MKIRTDEEFKKYIIRTSTLPNGIDKPTPYILVKDMIGKLDDVAWSDPNLKILDPAFGFGTFLFACYRKLVEFHSEEHILNNMLYGIEIEPFRYNLTKSKFAIKNLYLGDFLNSTEEIKRVLNMVKFDCVIGNSPYQMVTDGNSNPIWDRFVKKGDELLKPKGYLAMIHPAGWRNVDGRFSYVRDILLNQYQIERLEIYNDKDGRKTFGATTRYDWYVAQKIEPYKNTVVKFEDGTVQEIDLREIPFIPNHSYERIKSLIAKEGEERVNVLHSHTAYEHRKKHISKQKTEEFKYPVIYHVNKDETLSFKWSSDNTRGHYGIPKLVWIPNARINGTGYYVDLDGKYALSNFAIGIVDTPSNLKEIYKAFQSPEFKQLMSATFITFGGIDQRSISTFRKDFYKEFI